MSTTVGEYTATNVEAKDAHAEEKTSANGGGRRGAHASTARLTGVLDRIAVCYLLAALIFINTNWRKQVVIVACLLLVYWAILMLVPAHGFAAGDLTKEGSIASYVDRTLLGNHIWKGGDKIYDPEGFLSTIGALATTLCGVLTGHFLRTRRQPLEKVAAMFVAGTGCIVVGWAW